MKDRDTYRKKNTTSPNSKQNRLYFTNAIIVDCLENSHACLYLIFKPHKGSPTSITFGNKKN